MLSLHRTGLAVRYMSCDVRPICPVVKERVSLASGVYTGDAFELGGFIWKYIYSDGRWAAKLVERLLATAALWF